MASALTRIRFRVDLWLSARLLPWRVGALPLNRVVRLADPRAGSRYAGLGVDTIAKAVLRTTRHPWLMRDRRCLRQGLLGYRFLAEAGFAPELHFAVVPARAGRTELGGHCWVEIGGAPVLNICEPGMVPIWVHRGPTQEPT